MLVRSQTPIDHIRDSAWEQQPAEIYRTTAKAQYGLTDRELEPLPHREVNNPRYRSGPPARLYQRADVEALARSPAVRARLEKKARLADPVAKEARRVAREARITKRYSSWREALLPACEAMFNLNRYAKHHSCRCREEIYGLKNGLVALLYSLGFCTVQDSHHVAAGKGVLRVRRYG